jgi:hypothetical protein
MQPVASMALKRITPLFLSRNATGCTEVEGETMNLSIPLNSQRLLAIERFYNFRSKAVLGALLARLLSRPAALSSFAEILSGLKPNQRYAGIQNIPVDQITGSVGRPHDFDRSFRPLKTHLRDRWVANYLNMQAGHLEPIQVFKVGNQYFVEDGHHRVSVARATGMAYLQAEVWEYKAKVATAPAMPVRQPALRKVYAPSPACSCQFSSEKA